jgi:GAF domain-containing protein
MPDTAVLDAVLRAALDATAATAGWLVARDPDGLRVLAALGPGATSGLVGTVIPADAGVVGLVMASGQPMALGASAQGASTGPGVAALAGIEPEAVLCVPYGGTDATGAIELVDKVGGGRFSFDDVELVTVLAGIAGAAMDDADREPPPSPEALARSLADLASADPGRYADLARVVATLLDHG